MFKKNPIKHFPGMSLLPDQRQLIEDMYREGTSSTKIAKIVGCDTSTCLEILKHRGVPIRDRFASQRTYSINETYFRDIDTLEKAYWLGFLLADGCNTGFRINISLREADKSHIESFRKAIQSSAPITEHRFDGRILNNRKNTHTSFCRISIACKPMADDLLRHGVFPNKSKTALPWNGPPDLLPHFWRGVFDGDGSLYYSAGKWYFSLVGSEPVIRAFGQYASTICHQEPAIRFTRGVWEYRIGGIRLPRDIISVLYASFVPSLERKRVLSEQLLSTPSQRARRQPRK